MIDLLLLQELRKQIQEQLDENTQTADIVKLTLLLRLQRSYQSSTFSFRQRFEFLLVLFFQPSSLRCRSLRLIHDFVRLVALRTMPCGFNASLTQDVICKSHSLLTAFDAPPRLAQGFVFAVPATIKSNLVLYTMTYVIQCNVCLSNSLLDFPLYNACTMRTTIHNGERLHLFSFGITFEFICLPSCSILVFLRSFATTTGAHNNSRKKQRKRESYQDGEPEGY